MKNNSFTSGAGIKLPVICGAMYPCSNPELIAAVSQEGGIGIIQPVTLKYVYKYNVREGIRYIKSLTDKPVGFNALIEKTSKIYENRMKEWMDIALEEGIRFFVTALGNPDWVVKKVHSFKGLVYHDVTEEKWAAKAVDAGVDGLICVNNRAGGHAGSKSSGELSKELMKFNLPLICAGGIGNGKDAKRVFSEGYSGIQLGTRFIAAEECKASSEYKKAIINAREEDIVLTEKMSGVPAAVINTDYVKKLGLKAGPVGKYLLKHPKFKAYARTYYYLTSFYKIKKSALNSDLYNNLFQAGKSVGSIDRIMKVSEIMKEISGNL